MVTNPNAFLNKVKKPTAPTTPDYTKIVGFGDAGAAVFKGTPLDSGISNLGKAPAPEKQIFDQKFANQGGFKPVDVPQTPRVIPQQSTPTVPTAKNPVVEEVPAKPNTSNVDYTAVDNLDTQGLYRFIDNIQVRASSGEQISAQDQLLMREAQRKIQQSLNPATVANPYDTQIASEEQAKAVKAAELKAREEAIFTEEEKRLNALYARRNQDVIDSGQRTSQATARATSFSGFGRSTFNAEQQQKIQQDTENLKYYNDQEKLVALEKYRAELAGATGKELEGYNTTINSLREKSATFLADQAKTINEFNQKSAATYEDKINNLLAYASSWTDPKAPLTEDELAQAKAFGSLLIDKDGKVNEKFAEQIPAKLYGEALKSAAEARGAIPKDNFDFMNLGSGLVAKTNKVTGEVEWYQGDVKLSPLDQARINEINAGINKTVSQTPTSGAKPTGSIAVHAQTGRKLDSVALPAFSTAYNELMTSGVGKGMVFAEGARDQAQTIKAMGDRVGMPGASAAELRAAGHQIADVGKSDHENGMAIDVYANGSYGAPTAEQIAIMNKNGWYQTGGANDMGHFEYLGSQGGASGLSGLAQMVQNGSLKISDVPSEQRVAVANEIANAPVQKVLTPETRSAAQDALTLIQELKTASGKAGAVGGSFQKYLPGWIKPGEGEFVPGSPAAAYAAKVNRLRDLLAGANLDKLKGPMSDKDIQFVRNMATSLSLDMSEGDFDKTLTDLETKYSGLLGQVVETPPATSSTGGRRTPPA